MLKLGNHVLKIKATDEAGNFFEKEIQFSVATSIEAIRDNIKKYDSSIKPLLIEDLQWVKADVSVKWGK